MVRRGSYNQKNATEQCDARGAVDRAVCQLRAFSGGPVIVAVGQTGKKGSDKGIDGIKVFVDDNSGKARRVIVQVKSGHVKSGDILNFGYATRCAERLRTYRNRSAHRRAKPRRIKRYGFC